MAVIYTFRGHITLDGALHIGSGGSNDVTDATVVRDTCGQPYIPGSSFRGAFRAAVARLAPALIGEHPARLREEISDIQALRKRVETHVEQLRTVAQAGGEPFYAEESMQDALNVELSAMERLFGTVLWASPLTIPDLPLVAGDPVASEVRHGVGIDRDTGAASDQMKYDFEVVPRGHAFRLVMRCTIDSDYDTIHESTWLCLLAAGLRLLQMGELPLGGKVARGIGQVTLKDLEIFICDRRKKESLIALLRSNEPDARYGKKVADANQWIMEQLTCSNTP